DNTVSCPIYVQSSFDVPTIIGIKLPREYNLVPILQDAQKILFPSSSKESPFVANPFQMKPKDYHKFTYLKKIFVPTRKFCNIGTLLLPSNRSDIPKAAFTLGDPEDILDVSFVHKANRTETIEDANPARKAFLFSDPIVPLTLK